MQREVLAGAYAAMTRAPDPPPITGALVDSLALDPILGVERRSDVHNCKGGALSPLVSSFANMALLQSMQEIEIIGENVTTRWRWLKIRTNSFENFVNRTEKFVLEERENRDRALLEEAMSREFGGNQAYPSSFPTSDSMSKFGEQGSRQGQGKNGVQQGTQRGMGAVAEAWFRLYGSSEIAKASSLMFDGNAMACTGKWGLFCCIHQHSIEVTRWRSLFLMSFSVLQEILYFSRDFWKAA